MKSQVGRYTVVHESKAFPYFTVNIPPLRADDGNRGGTDAFLERVQFYAENRSSFLEAGVDVNRDCGFYVSCDEAWHVVSRAIAKYYGIQDLVTDGGEHEAL